MKKRVLQGLAVTGTRDIDGDGITELIVNEEIWITFILNI